MFAGIGALVMILTTLVPLVFTAVKAFPKITAFFRFLFLGSRGLALGRSGFWGWLLAAFAFIGGFGFLVSLYFGWGLRVYLAFFDFVFTPFAYVSENLIRSFVSQLPNLPPNTSSVLCLFDFGNCFTLLVTGFCFEVYMRVLIYFFVRRGK